MKNFTNNFKQFTSRLSARWLILALMMLVGTSSAWADPNWACSGASTWNGSSNSSYYVDSGCSFMSGNTSINDKDFGTLGNTFGIDFIVLINDNSKTFYGGTLNYKVDDASSFTQVKLTKDGDYNGNGKYKYYLDIVGLKLSGGKHTITFYLTVPKNTSSSSSASDWYISNNGNNYKFTFTIPTPTYTISYNANGGTGTIASQTKTKGTAITLSDGSGFSKTGYTLDSWNTNSAGTGTKYKLSASYTTDAALTLYAQWTANTYTITYKDQGGENFSGTHASGYPTTHTYGTATTLKTATKTGYTFEGWFTDPNCTTKVTSLGATAYASNITLYAKWQVACSLPTSIKITGEATPCAGNSQTYTATLDGGSGYTSSWTVPSGYTINSGSATTSATIKVGTAAGKITYTATCSSSSKISKDFDVAPINIVEPTISISNDGWTCPDANATITVTNAVLDGTYTYTLFNAENVQKGEVVKPTSGDVTFTVSTEDTYYVKATNACESKNSENVKLNNYSKPENPAVKITAPTKCQGVASNNGVINMKNPVVGVTYSLTKNGTSYTRRNNEWIGLAPGTYTLTANLDACSGLSASWNIDLTAEDITPVVETLTLPEDFESCDGKGISLALTDWNPETGFTYNYIWEKSADGNTYSTFTGTNSANVTTQLSGDTWYRVKVTKTGNNCTSDEATSKAVKVTALPVSKPAVSINSVVYNSAANKFTFSGTLDDAGCATDIEVGYQYRLKGNVDWSTPTEADEVSGNEFSAEISITNTIVDQVYEFQAYATNSAGTTYSSIFEVTISAAENCETSNADYIEILCTNPSAAAGATNSMYLYAWEMVNDVNIDLNGAFPGNKTSEGDFEYKGKKYASWHLKADKASIIFNNGDGNTQTNDITNLEKGKRYVYNYNPTAAKENRYTLVEDPSLIFAPEVETVSVSYKKVSDGLSVTFTGRINKKGCTTVSWYGYQSSTDDWKNAKNVMVGKTDVDAGTTFTKDTLLTAYGNYSFRARLINANSSKVYGEKVNITYTESDVVIAAVGDDRNVTTNASVYYDFVGLYVKSVMLPSSTDKIDSYEWQVKNGSSWETYNGGNVTVADRGVSAASNNIRPNKTGTYRCLVKIKNNNTPLVSNEIPIIVDASYSTSKSVITTSNRSLPVISVRTNKAFPGCSDNSKTPSAQTDHYKAKRSVDVKIFDKDGNLYYDRKARMNYRGSSSLNFKKKSYAFCTGDENCGQEADKSADYVKTKKMNLFGLSDGAKDKDWVLYAAAADPSFMRNRLAFDTYKEMRPQDWGVSSMYVELIIDGEYKGVYVLMDKVTVNENRVNITASNGFLVKFDKTDKEDRVEGYNGEYGDQKTFKTTRTGGDDKSTYDTTNDQRFEIEYPEKKDVVEDGGNWNATVTTIKNMFEDFEEALSTKDYPRVRQLIDYESWADWFIFNEFSKNVDAYRASCIFVYNGDKIEARPLWDQELSFNNQTPYSVYTHTDQNYKSTDQTNGLLIRNAKVYTDGFPAPFWFTGGDSNLTGGLLGDACFISVLRDRWDLHTGNGGALTAAKMQEKVNAYVDELGTAYSRDYTKWKEGNDGDQRTIDCKGGGIGYKQYSYGNSKKDLDNWIAGDIKDLSAESSSENRRSNLNYIIEKELEAEDIRIILTLSPEDGKTTPWIPVSVKVSAPKGYEYTYDESSILSVTGDDAPTRNAKGNVYTYTFPRPKDWGAGNVNTAIAPNEYNVSATLKMAGGTNECGSTIKLTTEATITLEDEGNDNCQ